MSNDVELDEAQLGALRRAAANSRYHLLLGAGASLDSTSRNGRYLPNSTALAQELADAFEVPLEDGDLLWRIYARAVEKAGAPSVYGWLRERFFQVKPPPWLSTYARFPWEVVWTLNLDDSFERAYEAAKSEVSRVLMPLSWDDDFRLGRELPVVHLHGHTLETEPRALVFSLTEYADAAVAYAAWPITFRDLYGVSPMVIIGARLRDEPDIEAVVARRQPEIDAPSFYVSPTISDAVAADLRSWNLIPVRMTGEQFTAVWAELTGMSSTEPPTRYEELALRVGRQFRELRTNYPGKTPLGHDFLGGDEPYWADIVGREHAELDWIRQGAVAVKRFGRDVPNSSALLYAGRRLTGRTTGLLAIARSFREAAWRVFLFTADERPDIDAVLQYAADGKSLVMIFDGIADVAEDVATIIARARQAQLKVACVAIDQFERSAGIAGRVAEALIVDGVIKSVNPRLTRTDAARLVDRLSRAGRLGILEREKDRARLAYFRGSELFAAMADLEEAPAFGRRVAGAVAELSDGLELELTFIAAMANRVGRGLTVIDAGRMLGRRSEEILRGIRTGSALSAVLSTDGQRVRTRQRWLALDPIIARLGTRPAVELLAQAMKRLSARIGRASQRERNATSTLVGSLMTYRNLAEIFPDQDLEDWYAQLLPEFGSWSGRYWEQRAIMSRHKGISDEAALARAESFAMRAVSLLRDPYSYTTLGTVLAARAAHGDISGISKFYDGAYDAFESAGKLDPQNLVTWLAFLRHALPILERVTELESPELADLEERIVDDWEEIYGQIQSLSSASESTQLELQSLRARFVRIVEGEGG